MSGREFGTSPMDSLMNRNHSNQVRLSKLGSLQCDGIHRQIAWAHRHASRADFPLGDAVRLR